MVEELMMGGRCDIDDTTKLLLLVMHLFWHNRNFTEDLGHGRCKLQ
jgi:hypothetical protein